MKKLIISLSIVCVCILACSSTKKANVNTGVTQKNVVEETIQVGQQTADEKAAQLAAQAQWKLDQPQILEYIEDNKLEAFWLNSGLYYVIEENGSGDRPSYSSTVKVHYTSTLLDGTPVWSTYDKETEEEHHLQNVILGWTQGIPLIQEGGKIKLIVPSGLAYGQNGWGEIIPPNSSLIFDIELIEIL